jgi:hypothetical protein
LLVKLPQKRKPTATCSKRWLYAFVG